MFSTTLSTLSSFFLLVSFSHNKGSTGSGFFLNYLSYMPFHVSSYKHLSFAPRFFSLYLHFFTARFSFPHSVLAFSHFLWLVPPSHSFSSLATVGFGQLLRSPIGQQPEEKKKKKTSSPYFSHNGPTSPSPGQAVSHCSELTGGVGGNGVGVGEGASN